MDDTRTRLQKCFVAVFPELTPQAAWAASPTTVPRWDSLSSVTLFTLIEEEFGLSLSPDALDEFGSFTQILARLEDSGRR